MLIRAAVSFVIVAVLLVMAIAFSTSKGLGGNSLTEALAFLGGQLFHGLMALTVLVAALEVMSTISCLLQLFLIGASGFDFITVYSFRLRFSPAAFRVLPLHALLSATQLFSGIYFLGCLASVYCVGVHLVPPAYSTPLELFQLDKAPSRVAVFHCRNIGCLFRFIWVPTPRGAVTDVTWVSPLTPFDLGLFLGWIALCTSRDPSFSPAHVASGSVLS